MSRRTLLAGALASAGGAYAQAPGQGPAPGPIDPKALQHDCDLLRQAFQALHPGLLRYNSRDEIDGRFQALRAGLAQPQGLAQAHLAFARLTASVRCGHTYLNPWNQEGASLALNAAGRTRLPFRFRWLGGRMVVTGGPADPPALAPGSEVIDLGGVRPAALLAELAAYAQADGHNDAKRRRLMELHGDDEWELFDIYLPLLHPDLVAAGEIWLTVRSPSGAVSTVEAPLLDRATRLAQVDPGVVTRGSSDPAWRLERLGDGSGWLTMRTWEVYDSKWDWQGALNTSLDALAADNAPGLVVDLRGNGGGLDVGDLILARRVDADTPKTGYQRYTRYRRTPAELDPYLKTWDKAFRDWGDKAIGPDAAGFFRLTRYDDDAQGDLIRPQGRRFRGKLIVLIDAANSSATFQFADAVKSNGLGVLVGETSGGSRRGINGGAFFFFQMPGSGLEIDIPLIATFPTTPEPDAGVEPDHPVVFTAADIAAGRDPQREAALALLRS